MGMSECLVQHGLMRYDGRTVWMTFPATFPATFPVDDFAPDMKFSRFDGLALVSSVFHRLF
jgi:hypothetical protein